MKFIKHAILEAKSTPKIVWIAAVVIPGGLVAVSAYFLAKGTYTSIRGKK